MHRKTAGKIADRIGRLENVLNECIERVLDEREHIQIEAICLLIKAYTNHKGSIDCFSFNPMFTLPKVDCPFSAKTNSNH